jgi:hemerythrin
VQAHDKFRHELEQMMVDNADGHDSISRQLISTFLREWLKRHVFGIDKPLEAFLLAAEAK